jgi:ABC-2 type transport system permease protein
MPIFDQGYQHWQGPLSGRMWRWLTIARHGVRVQRNNRLLRIFMLVAWIQALGLIGAMVVWGLVERKIPGVLGPLNWLPADLLQDPNAYRAAAWTLAYSFFFKVELFFVMLLVAIAGPGLISQDLRFNALPLYFARPLTRLDYFLGKLGVIGALVASIAVGPAVFAYVVGLCFCLDLSAVKDTYPILLASVAYGLVITLSAGTLILALSSLTRRSLYVGITWAGFWIVSSMVGGIMTEIHRDSVREEIQITEMNRWFDEHPPPQGARVSDTPHGHRPQLHANPKTGKLQLAGLRPEQERQGDRWYQAWIRAEGRAVEKAHQEQNKALQKDWRPLCSYVANLERMADLLLDTDSAWVKIGRAIERSHGAAFEHGIGAAPLAERRARAAEAAARERRMGGAPLRDGAQVEMSAGHERQLADQMVPQYPWWWSAGVLAGLLGISTWILNRRVKSLDRLR